MKMQLQQVIQINDEKMQTLARMQLEKAEEARNMGIAHQKEMMFWTSEKMQELKKESREEERLRDNEIARQIKINHEELEAPRQVKKSPPNDTP